MTTAFEIAGYAIVSSNGMIADSDCLMPNSLKFEADQQFLDESLDAAALLVHGRKSHECQERSHQRRRLLLTRSVETLRQDETTPNQWLWNPAGVSLEDACAEVGVREGRIAIIGGTAAYDMFLDRYDAFHICRARKVFIPDGTPVFSRVKAGATPEQVLKTHGLQQKLARRLDEANEVDHVCWTR